MISPTVIPERATEGIFSLLLIATAARVVAISGDSSNRDGSSDMPRITNDQELRAALDRLSIEDQRTIGLLFAGNIKIPKMSPALQKALDLALDADNGDQERELAYKTAKSVAANTYTACGRDTDWEAQAEHFVAAACSAALAPEAKLMPATDPAWRSAVQSRMANNCLMMESAISEVRNEAQKQYEICEEFLQALG